MIKEYNHQENIIPLRVYAPNNKASKCKEQKPTELTEIDKSKKL